MFASIEDSKDLWLVFELCGQPLSKILFKTKGTFHRGERIYDVVQDPRVCYILEKDNCK